MELRHKTTGVVSNLTLHQLNAKIKPSIISPPVLPHKLQSVGYEVVLATPKPTPSARTKQSVRDGVAQDTLGNWVQAWTEVDMFTPYTDEAGRVFTVAEQETSFLAKVLQDEKDKRIAEIDSQTNESIVALVGSEIPQRNMIAKHSSLVLKLATSGLTTEESAMLDQLTNVYAQIESMREAGNAAEQVIQDTLTLEDF